MTLVRGLIVALLLPGPWLAASSAQQPVPGPRDPVAGTAIPAGTATLAGTVLVEGTGQPARRARVSLSSTELRGSRTMLTDDHGRFVFAGLAAGRYSLTVSKPGHVGIAYGQNRPGAGRPGTPIQLSDGQTFEARLQMPRGGVITGTLLDEQGEAVPGTPVRVLRHALRNGTRALEQAGTGSTDDRGIYRVYGLQPGEYLVVALPRRPGGPDPDRLRTEVAALRERAAALAPENAPLARQLLERATAQQSQLPEADDQATGYAPVYYPGTTVPSTAASIVVGAGEERSGVDFQLQLVPIARIDGIVVSATSQPLQSAQVVLVAAGQAVPGLGTQSTRADRDGRFSLTGVAPGQYTLLARSGGGPMRGDVEAFQGPGGRGGVPAGRGQRPFAGRGSGGGASNPARLWAMTTLVVDGHDVANVVLPLQPGMSIAGRITFEGAAQAPDDASRLRVTLVPAEPGVMPRALATPAQGTVDASGRFSVADVVPGRYRLSASGAGPGWFLESAVIDGQDTLDFPVEVKPNQNVTNALITFSDRQAELSGLVTDSRGRPASEYTLLAFSADPRYWTPQSRRIQSTRPATDGRFIFRSLPPGEYRLTAIVDPEPGSWFDPAFLQQLESSTLRVSLAEGEKKVQDLRLSLQ
ncbi:MAG TPA: carboxypeptidase regulatory-like domain-containing protein [Vicinamibacterales bacterium]|nr:carboxypeptidase regulatory-like domain-containing protein [Vicinamibacterales bacterium]